MEKEKLLSSIRNQSNLKRLHSLIISVLLCCSLAIKVEAFASDNVKLLSDQKSDFNKMFNQDETVNFYMFASFSLSDTHLRQMMDYAKMYNGVIVFRGIENNSFQKMGKHIQSLARDGDEASIIIDPTLFKEFQIVQVPSYVLSRRGKCPVGTSCKVEYDKIIGNMTPKYALERFIEKGELSQVAQGLLGGIG